MVSINNTYFTVGWNDIINKLYNNVPAQEIEIYNKAVKSQTNVPLKSSPNQYGMLPANYFITRLKVDIQNLTNASVINDTVLRVIHQTFGSHLLYQDYQVVANMLGIDVEKYLMLRTNGIVYFDANTFNSFFRNSSQALPAANNPKPTDALVSSAVVPNSQSVSEVKPVGWKDIINKLFNNVPPQEIEIYNKAVTSQTNVPIKSNHNAYGMLLANYFINRLKVDIQNLTNPSEIHDTVLSVIRQTFGPHLLYGDYQKVANILGIDVEKYLMLRSNGIVNFDANTFNSFFKNSSQALPTANNSKPANALVSSAAVPNLQTISEEKQFVHKQQPIDQAKPLHSSAAIQNRPPLHPPASTQPKQSMNNAHTKEVKVVSQQAQPAAAGPKNEQASSAAAAPKNEQAQSAAAAPKNEQTQSAAVAPKNEQAAQNNGKSIVDSSADNNPMAMAGRNFTAPGPQKTKAPESPRIKTTPVLPVEENSNPEITDLEYLKQARSDLKGSYNFVLSKKTFTDEAVKDLKNTLEQYKDYYTIVSSLLRKTDYHRSFLKYYDALKRKMIDQGLIKN